MSGNKHTSGKSKRRQEKKAQRELRSFNSWSEVNALAANIREGLAMHYGIATALRQPGIQENLPDRQLVADNLRLLQKDLTKLSNELNETSARHAGYDGYCKPNDVQLLLDILSRYDSLASEYQANVVPVANIIIEQIAASEAKVIELAKAAQQAAAEQPAETQEPVAAEAAAQ